MAMAPNGLPPSSKPHALVLPYPLQGHITPFMHLSKLLAARGFHVSFVSTEFNIQSLRSAKQGLMAADLNTLGICLVGIPDGLDSRPRDCILDPISFLASLHFLHTSFDELVGRMVVEQEVHISCIISDSFLLWSQDVADKWRIPRVCFWPQALSTLACSASLPNIMATAPDLDPFKEEVYRRGSPRILDCIPGLPNMESDKLPFLTLGGEVSVEWMRSQITSQMARVNAPLCIICNTFPDLEKEVHAHLKEILPSPSPPILSLGPLLPSAFLGGQDGANEKGTGSSLCDEDEECVKWLDMQLPRSVLYISLGSVAILDDKDAQEVAMGLEACKVPFLWVLRSLPCELASTVQKLQGKVVRWAPQLRVLSHATVDGFLTHCGWNSVLESACMGVPIIGWPQMMDQVTNCWLQVEKLKVGMRLEFDTSTNRVGRASIEKAVRMLMQDKGGQQMTVCASDFSNVARSAIKTSLSSNLDALIEMILTSQRSLA